MNTEHRNAQTGLYEPGVSSMHRQQSASTGAHITDKETGTRWLHFTQGRAPVRAGP